MANFEITPGTTANGVQVTGAANVRRSTRKMLRLGNKKHRLFLIIQGGVNQSINETIAVRNGRRGAIWAVSLGITTPADIADIVISPTSSGSTTSFNISEDQHNWRDSVLVFAVEVGE